MAPTEARAHNDFDAGSQSNLPTTGRPLSLTPTLMTLALILTSSLVHSNPIPQRGQRFPSAASQDYYVVGDIRYSHGSHKLGDIIQGSSKGWPGGVVPYSMPGDYPTWLGALVRQAMSEVENEVGGAHTKNGQPLPATCLHFRPRTWEQNYLEVKDERTCHATVGYSAREPMVLSVSPPCARLASIKHQLLHVLGFGHEHERPDRDVYLDVHFNNTARPWEFRRRRRDREDLSMSTPYDLRSIMHFGPYTEAKDPRLPVLTPKPEYAAGLKMGQAHTLSAMDILRVQRLYGCPEQDIQQVVEQRPTGTAHRILFACDFEDGMCGMTTTGSPAHNDRGGGDLRDSDKNDGDEEQEDKENGTDNDSEVQKTLPWSVLSGPTPDGPAAGNTNGIDPYLYVSPRLAGWVMTQASEAPHTGGHRTHSSSNQPEDRINGGTVDGKGAKPDLERTLSAEVAALLRAAGGPDVPLYSASIFTPIFTAGRRDGALCVEYQVFQTDARGGLTVTLHPVEDSEVSAGERGRENVRQFKDDSSGDYDDDGDVRDGDKVDVVDDLEGIILDGWSGSGFTLHARYGWRYRLQLTARVGGGAVALDDIYIRDGPCV